MDVLELDATAQLQLLAMRQISAVELLAMTLAKERQGAMDLNAIIRQDVKRAALTAKAHDDRRLRGDAPLLLGGLPMTVSDLLDVEGMAAAAGIKAWRQRRAVDAACVSDLRRVGAILWGKSNTSLRGEGLVTQNPLYGLTPNPYDHDHLAGGACGGAATAVASGISALEIGPDQSGEARLSAHFCGLFGFRPSGGLMPLDGVLPPSPKLRVPLEMMSLGVLARSGRDLRLILSALAPGMISTRAEPLALGGVRIGYWGPGPHLRLDPSSQAVIEAYVQSLLAQKVRVDTYQLPLRTEDLLSVHHTLRFGSRGHDMDRAARRILWVKRVLADLFGPLWPHGAKRARALGVSHHHWLLALEQRETLGAQILDSLSELDFLLCPVAALPAPAMTRSGQFSLSLRLTKKDRLHPDQIYDWCALASVMGLPSLVVPAGQTPEGLPVGLQILAKRGEDAKLLSLALALDEAVMSFVPPALLKA